MSLRLCHLRLAIESSLEIEACDPDLLKTKLLAPVLYPAGKVIEID